MKIVGAVVCLSACFACGMAKAEPVAGLRAEIVGGFDATSLHREMSANPGRPPLPPVGPLPSNAVQLDGENLNGTGPAFGFGIGYDVAIAGRFSLGLDGEYSEIATKLYQSPVRNTTVAILNPLSAFVLARRDLSFGRDLYIGGRITVPVHGAFNAYVKAGYTNLRVNDTQTVAIFRVSSSPISPLPIISDPVVVATTAVKNVGGVRLGAGAQMTVRGKLYTMLEYRFSSYSNDISRNQVIAGVGLRF